MGQDTHRILVVDDTPTFRLLLSGILTKQGYEVESAVNGTQALEFIDSRTFDLIVLDVVMPDISGIDVLKEIRRDHGPASLPVIMVTADHDKGKAVQGLKHGANDYVEKPLDYPILFARIEGLLSYKRVNDDLLRTKEGLEQRVVERTSELRILNEGLEHEIQERKRIELELRSEITQRRDIEAALRAGEERYRLLYDSNPAMLFTVDVDGQIRSINQCGAEQLGYDVVELTGKSFDQLFHDRSRDGTKHYFSECGGNPGDVYLRENRKIRKDGTLLWTKDAIRLVRDTEGKDSLFIVCEDITEARNLSRRLAYQATHDELTGLINRREFERRLKRLLGNVRDTSNEHVLCYLDLDQFKLINDTCGHIVGDELLRQLTKLLKGKVRDRDSLARLGGDEFGILMEHCSMAQANRLANALRKEIENFKFVWDSRQFNIGASIGLAPITSSSKSITALLSEADTACYEAKDAGRNRVKEYSAKDSTIARRHGDMQQIFHLHRALEENRFLLYFQPIQRLAEDEATGLHYELLIRMQDANNNLISPSAFLPAAERFNLAAKLDRWVISTALRWLKEHPSHLRDLSLCSINLSGQSLADEETHEFIIQQLDSTGLPTEKICFEITETAAIANMDKARSFITFLKEAGCSFALDDFGSGLSSFGYLKNLPVDYLKIDGEFIRNVMSDPVGLAMVKSINDIGHLMGKKTIAEFVESETVLQQLRGLGVDYAQGYHIGMPLPIDLVALDSPGTQTITPVDAVGTIGNAVWSDSEAVDDESGHQELQSLG